MAGIYCIENIVNNKKYIGQTKDFDYRKRKHFSRLKNNSHDNKLLQQSYNEFGEDNFIFYILEECEQEQLNEKEILWIEKLDAYTNGFNQTIGGKGINGWKASDEFKKHMSEIERGENNPNYGNYWSDEQKKIASEKFKGKYAGKNNPKAKAVICVEELKIFDTINDATDYYQYKNPTSVSRAVKNKTLLAGKYHFAEYSEDFYEYLGKHKFEYLCDCYKNKKVFADLNNQLFYRRYELKKYLYETNSETFTTRDIDEISKQKEFVINNVQYVLL